MNYSGYSYDYINIFFNEFDHSTDYKIVQIFLLEYLINLS